MKSIAAGLDNAPRLGPGTFIAVRIPEWPHVTGFAMERTWPMAGVELPPGCLTLHVLIGPELDAAGAVGPLGILARLGSRAHFWPTPAWCDPRRAPVAEPGEATFIAKVRAGHFPSVTVTLEDRTIALRASRSALPRLADLAEIDPREPFVLFTSLDLRADALFSWRPGEEVATAHTLGRSPGARIAGCFFAVFPHRKTDSGAVARTLGRSRSRCPNTSKPAGAAIAADSPVACIGCGGRIPLAAADVVGMGYRCPRCSKRSQRPDALGLPVRYPRASCAS